MLWVVFIHTDGLRRRHQDQAYETWGVTKVMVDWNEVLVDSPAQETLLDMLKSFMGIEDETQNAELTRGLNLAGPMVERYLDRVVAEREVTQHFPNHFDTVVLHNYPIIGDVVVMLNGDQQETYEWYRDAGGLVHLSKSGQAWDAPMDWRKFDNVDVVYTAGWAEVPVDLAYGICNVASLLAETEGTGDTLNGGSGELRSFQLYDVGSLNYQTNSASGQTMMLQSGMIPNSVAEMISSYRRWST